MYFIFLQFATITWLHICGFKIFIGAFGRTDRRFFLFELQAGNNLQHISFITLLQYSHCSITFLLIGPLIQRACVYLHADDSFSFAGSSFPLLLQFGYHTWKVSVYLCLPQWHIDTNENRNGAKRRQDELERMEMLMGEKPIFLSLHISLI